LLHQVGDLFALNIKLWCQKVNIEVCVYIYIYMHARQSLASHYHLFIQEGRWRKAKNKTKNTWILYKTVGHQGTVSSSPDDKRLGLTILF